MCVLPGALVQWKSWLLWMCVFMFYWQWSTLFPKPAAFHSYLILPLARGPIHMHVLTHTCIKPHTYEHTNMQVDMCTHTNAHRKAARFSWHWNQMAGWTEIASWMKLSTFQTIKKGIWSCCRVKLMERENFYSFTWRAKGECSYCWSKRLEKEIQ